MNEQTAEEKLSGEITKLLREFLGTTGKFPTLTINRNEISHRSKLIPVDITGEVSTNRDPFDSESESRNVLPYDLISLVLKNSEMIRLPEESGMAPKFCLSPINIHETVMNIRKLIENSYR